MTVPSNSVDRKIAYWLMSVALMVFLMALIGAITRLTGSGLSMVEWRPLIGALPPLSDSEWMRVFDAYKRSPEYQHINNWMQIDDFKTIFFWEWFHRLWGRLIGLAFFLPALWFLVTKQIDRHMLPRIAGICGLGLLQAGVGWWMVKSGLADNPAVSHYRLSIHLGIALCILVALWCQALTLFIPASSIKAGTRAASRRSQGLGLLALLAVTIIWGAFTAGKDAGLVYNSWPKMGDEWLPTEAMHLTPAWLNLFESHGVIQFTHRSLASLLCILTLIYGLATWRALPAPAVLARGFALALPFIAVSQFLLGVLTVLYAVPTSLGVLHQAGGLIFLLCLTGLLTATRAA